MTQRMTAEEAERRFDSIMICGGTKDERRYALKRWMDAYRREWYEQRAEKNQAAAKALSGS